MIVRRLLITLVAATAVSCASAPLPPAVQVTDVARLAGNYSGTTHTVGMGSRSTRVVVYPTGDFEMAVADPDGFRRLGKITVDDGGGARYQYDEVKNTGKIEWKGAVAVHERDGRRVLVLRRDGGDMTTTVSTTVP